MSNEATENPASGAPSGSAMTPDEELRSAATLAAIYLTRLKHGLNLDRDGYSTLANLESALGRIKGQNA